MSDTDGSIGPQRARCLKRLRRSPALAALSGGVARGSHSRAAKHFTWKMKHVPSGIGR